MVPRKLAYSILLLLLSSFLFESSGLAQSPAISYTTPVNGPVGTSITIVGSNFGTSRGSSTITFNGTAAAPTSWSNTQIVAPVPTGATTGSIVVTVGGIASNKVNFTVGTPPTISYTTPVNGPVGTSVTIFGNYFGATQSSSTVEFNGTAAAPTSWSNTQIVVPVPTGATTGSVVVTVGGVASNKVSFTVGTPPTISYTTPVDGPVGTSVTIVGNYFGATQSSSSVTFNGTAATPTSWSNTQIVAPVPTGATTGSVVVTAGGVASNKVNFTVGTPPTISYTLPVDGPVGTSVTINGNYFGSTAGTVTFNGIVATPTSWSNTQITVPVPSGSTTGPVVVTTGGMPSNSVHFIVGTPPTISYTNPIDGPVGMSVSLVGNYFGATQGSSTVSFNGISAAPTNWANSQIVVPVPAGASTGPVIVTVGGMASNSVNFIVGTPPTISYTNPTGAPVGSSITIVGNYFGTSQGSSTITFNGISAAPTSWSDSQIVVPVPAGASTGPLVVTAAGITGNSVNFTVPPAITTVIPASAPVGSSVTITGTSFGLSQGTSTITFNGVTATPTSWNAQSIVVPVPSGATPGSIVVTVGGVASAGANFTVTSLNSIALTPTTVSIPTGQTFQFALTGTYSDGTNLNVSSSATWSSSAQAVATVNSSGLATAATVGSTIIQAAIGSLNASANLGVVSQTLTGSLPTALDSPTLTVLNDGTVLEAGGSDSNGNPLASASVYNPSAGTFTPTGSLASPRYVASATLLNNGQVLVAGGVSTGTTVIGTTELFSPVAGTFSSGGNLITARSGHTATLLPSGLILIAGGDDANGNPLNSAELFNPVTGASQATGNLNTARDSHVAVSLNDGTVLIAGGLDSSGNVLQSAEIYNPQTALFTVAPSMVAPRALFKGVLLNNGSVLLAGGVDSNKNSQASAELYNPSTQVFSATGSMTSARSFFTATLLNNGTVLLAGGLDASGNVLGTAELYDPVAGTATPTANFITPRYVDTAVLLTNGNVLEIAGLDSNFNRLASAELFQPSSLTPQGLQSISLSPSSPTINAAGTQGFVATGTFADGSTERLASVTWSSSSSSVATITNDVTNQGNALASNPGTTTISACAGAVCGSTVLTSLPGGAQTPAISSVSPTAGSVGTTVTITGVYFGSTPGSSTITFNGVASVPVSWSSNQIVVQVPLGAASGPLNVVIAGTTLTAASQFWIIPSIASISTNAGPIGTAVAITGSGFGTSMATGAVTLGSSPGTVASWTDTQIIALVAPGSSSGFVQVQQGGYSSNSLSFTVSAVPTLTSISPSSGPAGAQVTFVGAGFGASQGNGRVLLGNTFGAIASWSDTQIVATVAPGSATGTAQVIQGGFASNSYAFAVTTPTPSIASFNPSSGPAGTQVTITGSGFGATQGSGRVLLGTTNGNVTSWSDSQIIATIALGSSSGFVQVLQLGASSNSLPFTVSTPTITSISPTSGGPGAQVTISGSGFGAVQGSGNVWLGTTYGSIVSWSDAQVVATVAAASGSGNAQILQNGVWSNSVPFTSSAPNIASVSPSSGSAGTQVTISGSGFGSNAGNLQLGTLPAVISSWSDSQIVATAATNSLTGIAQVQQNGLLSNAVRFVVPTAGFGTGNAVTITPSRMNLLVGQTHAIQALNQAGSLVTGLTWTSSDPTIVSLSTDDPPVLTALAPGHVTITAGDSSCDVTVWTGAGLPVGTTIWSAPGDGSGVAEIIPAVPSPTGVADTFAIQNSGTVQALTADGQVAWTATLDSNYTSVNADFFGGLVETTPSAVKRFDGISGQETTLYNYNNSGYGNPTNYHTDGTIFTVDGGMVVGLDPTTNAVKFTVAMDQSSNFEVHTCEYTSTVSGQSPPNVGTSLLAGDGNFYVYYQYSNTSYADAPLCSGDAYVKTTSDVLLQVGSDGSSSKFFLGQSSITDEVVYFNDQYSGFIDSHSEGGSSAVVTSLFSNANQGVIATYQGGGTNSYCSTLTYYFYPNSNLTNQTGCVPATTGQTAVMTIGGSGPTPQVATWGNFTPRLQALDGTFYGTMADGSLGALDPSGNVKWTSPGIAPQMILADGSVVGYSSSGEYQVLDPNGVNIGMATNLPELTWKGAYQIGSVDSVVAPTITLMTSLASIVGGNLTGNATPFVHHSFGLFWCGSGYASQGYVSGTPCIANAGHDVVWGYYPLSIGPTALQDFSAAHPSWVGTIESKALQSFQRAYAKYPILVQLADYQPSKTLTGYEQNPMQEYVAYVLGDSPAPAYGVTVRTTPNSKVYYFAFMESAQTALGGPANLQTGAGWNNYSPTYPPQDTSGFVSMLTALGTALGNTAAHEMGHHLEDYGAASGNVFPNMDCGSSPENTLNPGVACENNDNFVYAFFNGSGLPQEGGTSGGAMFFYGVPGGTPWVPPQTPIHWGTSDDCWLRNYASPGSCK